jgi:type I restriction enzyme S subunit
MNQSLEAMAQAIFKSWFVDFDPVRAKAKGRDHGLPKKIANLFPNSFEDSDLGEIPKGWRVETVGEVCELAYGKALKADQRRPGNVPVMGSNGQVGSHDETLVKGPGIVVGRKGNPGIIKWVSSDFFPIDTTFYVVPLSKNYTLTFLAFALDNLDLSNLGADSAVPGLNRNIAYMSNILVPTPEVLCAFDKVASLIRIRQKSTEEESRTLAALRDSLLPKLISGELRIPEAEKLMERVA